MRHTEVPDSQLMDHMRGASPGLVGELGPRRWYRGDRPVAPGTADSCRVSRWPDQVRLRIDLVGLGRGTLKRPGQDHTDLVGPDVTPAVRRGRHRDKADLVAIDKWRAKRGVQPAEIDIVGTAVIAEWRGRHQDRADLVAPDVL